MSPIYFYKKLFDFCFADQKVALFALGKLGCLELNLSSDVDVLLVAENEAAVSLPRLRKFQKLLTERTFSGFVFRVDFDLRPGGKQGPLIPTLDQFKDYYGNYGETWERLAFVRLRPLCGDDFIKKEVMAFARKFSFRRHLDFTLLEDLKNLRTKIQGHYWARTQHHVVDLKLGVGGIRDVELFCSRIASHSWRTRFFPASARNDRSSFFTRDKTTPAFRRSALFENTLLESAFVRKLRTKSE